MLTEKRIHQLWNASTKFINGYGQPEILEFARAIEAEVSHASVPGGYALVPVEPTQEMVDAGCKALGALYGQYGSSEAYKAMIAAAPTPPVSEDRKDMPTVQSIPKERLALNVRHQDCHKAADAFWKYWNEYGETHKHGYYESTWGAINQALRTVGVVEHEYRKADAAMEGK